MTEQTSQGDTEGLDVEALVASVLSKNAGDSTKTIEMLLNETYNLRQKNAGLRTDVATLEGQSVLNTDEAEQFNAYKALGSIEDIQGVKDALSEKTGELSQLQRKALTNRVANDMEFNVDVLERLLRADEAVLIQSGEDAVIRVKGGDEQDFAKYVEENWGVFESSLQGKTGNRYVTQSSSKQETKRSTNAVDAFLAQNAERAKQSPFN